MEECCIYPSFAEVDEECRIEEAVIAAADAVVARERSTEQEWGAIPASRLRALQSALHAYHAYKKAQHERIMRGAVARIRSHHADSADLMRLADDIEQGLRGESASETGGAESPV